MPNFKNRSTLKEFLDDDNIPYRDIEQNMAELNIINLLLGGHAISIIGVNTLLQKETKTSFTICEIGCGGGDNLFAIATYLKKKKKHIQLIGVDIKKECLETAQKNYSPLQANWIASDYKKVNFEQKPDVIFSSLFCHHFSNEDLGYQLQWMNENCTLGFFINDLQRHPLAYYSIKLITKLFSKSYLVKNDAPISVLRGFTKKDWKDIIEKAGITNYSIQWKWAFRYLIIVHK